MNCKIFQEHLGELLYADRGEPLDEGLASRLREHAEHCGGCAAELGALKRVQGHLDALEDVPAAGNRPCAPINFYTKLARLRRSRNGWRAVAYGAAALSLLFLMAWLSGLWSSGTAGTGPVATEKSAGSSALQPDWGQEVQRLTAAIKDHDKLMGLLTRELRSVEQRQAALILELDKRVAELDKDADLQSLQVAALKRDIELVRRFLTRSNDVARIDAPYQKGD